MPSLPDPRASIRTDDDHSSPSGYVGRSRRDAAAEARLEGFRSGREEGFHIGREEGRSTAHSAVAGALAALTAAATELTRRDTATRAEIEQVAVALALELTETLIGHRLETLEPGSDVITRALGLRRGNEPMRILMHPADAAVVDGQPHPGVEIVADTSVGRGQASAEIGEAVADLSIDAAIARVREALA